jgi:hypothetical protein
VTNGRDGDVPPMPAMPATTFAVMLRTKGSAGYVTAGHAALAAQPSRGETIELAHCGRSVRGTVDALFIPPGCEENCIGTLFVSEA